LDLLNDKSEGLNSDRFTSTSCSRALRVGPERSCAKSRCSNVHRRTDGRRNWRCVNAFVNQDHVRECRSYFCRLDRRPAKTMVRPLMEPVVLPAVWISARVRSHWRKGLSETLDHRCSPAIFTAAGVRPNRIALVQSRPMRSSTTRMTRMIPIIPMPPWP
jgi:hypothetical protein